MSLPMIDSLLSMVTEKAGQVLKVSSAQLQPEIEKFRFRVFLIFSGIIFIFCFRPIVAFREYTAADDSCYAEWLALLLGQFHQACGSSSYPPGVALAWLPAGLVASLVTVFSSHSFAEILPIFVGILSFLYWCACIFLVDRILILTGSLTRQNALSFKSFLISYLLVLAVPVLYYSTHRTTMVHAPEFFFSLLFIYLLLRAKPVGAYFLGLGLTLLRFDDFLTSWVAVLLLRRSRTKYLFLFVTGVGTLALMNIFHGTKIGEGYNALTYQGIWVHFTSSRIQNFFIGGDWGVIWTAPWYLFCFASGLFWFKELSRVSKSLLIWVGVEFLIAMSWPGNGSDFAYRYLIGAYAAVILIWTELFFDAKNLGALYMVFRKISLFLLCFEAAFLFWINWIYKEFKDVTPFPPDSSQSMTAWTHPDLLINSLKSLVIFNRYKAPLLHSPFAALYYTLTDPSGRYGFEEGYSDLRFIVLFIATALFLGIIFHNARKIYKDSIRVGF